MQLIRSLFFIFISVSLYIGCSDVGFQVVKGKACEEFKDGTCTVGEYSNSFNLKLRSGLIDVLFVVDNSGSMYVEQQNMSQRIGNLVDALDLKNIDFQMAVITTDVSASPGNNVKTEANGNGAFQDGKFLAFPNGKPILKSTDGNESYILEQLQGTIQRQETLNCDQNNYAREFCPSNDERGIYSLNMALDRKENSSFFRRGAHLAVIILSDEDERTSGDLTAYPAEPYDLPATFVEKIKSQLGETKTASVHSVIIKRGDTACYNSQIVNVQNSNFPLEGKYGDYYAALSNPSEDLLSYGNLIPGSTGSICSSNYGSQIAISIPDNVDRYQLPCPPMEDSLIVKSSETGSAIEYELDSNNLLTVDINPGSEVDITFECLIRY